MNKNRFTSVVWVLGLVLTACSANAGVATEPVQPAVTLTPAATIPSTSTPTPGPTPEPDARAMIAWQELGLSNEFTAFPPNVANLDEGASAYPLTAADGSILQYTIAGSFVVSDNLETPTQIIFGYTFLLPAADTAAFDAYTQSGTANFLTTLLGNPAAPVSPLANASDIGNASGGATVEFDDNGTLWRLSVVAFRVDGIGALVFVRNRSDVVSPAGVDQVARLYAESILNPTAPATP